MSWLLTHRTRPKEMQIVLSLDGIDQTEWEATRMGRAPHAHEVWDAAAGKLRDHRKDVVPMPRTPDELDAMIQAAVAKALNKGT